MEPWADEPGRSPPYPLLAPDETCFPRDERVDLQHPLKREGCALYVTTHRVLVRAGGERLAWSYASLASVGVEKPGLLWDKSWKLVLRDAAGGDLARLAFTGGGHDVTQRAVEAEMAAWRAKQAEAVKRRREAEAPVAVAATAVRAEAARLAAAPCVSLAKADAEQRKRANEALAERAFQSLEDLAAMGEEVGKKVERYAHMLAAAAAKSGGGGGEGAAAVAGAPAAGVAGESDLMNDILREMGSVARPVTRETSGSKQYEASLAAQFADFIRPKVERAGGLLPLTDAYYFYNRGRGVDVVAPRDLLLAVGVMERTPALGLRPRALGGQRVLQLAELSDAAMVARVEAHLRSAAAAAAAGAGGGGDSAAFTSAVGLAAATGAPLAVATLQLQLAEAAGAVCRDVSLAGTRFFLADPFKELATR